MENSCNCPPPEVRDDQQVQSVTGLIDLGLNHYSKKGCMSGALFKQVICKIFICVLYYSVIDVDLKKIITFFLAYLDTIFNFLVVLTSHIWLMSKRGLNVRKTA